jgi:pantoate--beta-alanine ligase
VLKLFNIVRPHVTVFGQKDAQQLVLVRRMIEDLWLGIELITGPTVRDERGLALSSRNRYLTPEHYEAALAIPRSLEKARAAAAEQASSDAVESAAREELQAESLLEIDYVQLVHPKTLRRLDDAKEGGLLLVAVRCGGTRLIDNTTIDPATTGDGSK